MKKLIYLSALIILVMLGTIVRVGAQTTSFTYQGRLNDTAVAQPTNGTYNMQFALFNALSDGTQLGSTLTIPTVAVTNGIFTANLDFGANFPGSARFLEIRVFSPATSGYITLAPRLQISNTPYAIRSLSSSSADTAANATQLGGVAANQFVVTTDPRMTDARPPTTGSSNYIQNGTAAQNSSFNINGSGKASSFSGQFFTATSEYDIGNFRMMTGIDSTQTTIVGIGANTVANPTGLNNSYFGHSTGTNTSTGSDNSFFGRAAGMFNVSGSRNSYFGSSAGTLSTANDNSFFGYQSGSADSTGFENSFFGSKAGNLNSTGSDSSFFGTQAGQNNTTGTGNSFIGAAAGSGNQTGNLNTFVGVLAGRGNISGVNNTVLGTDADLLSDNLINATAIGYHSAAGANNTLILGGILGVNSCTFSNNCGDTKVGIGTTTPAARLHVNDPLNNGLRVQTNIAGGNVASFGGNGSFQIDSAGVAGGRLQVSENGNVGIGTNAPNTKLVVNGGSVYVTNPNTVIITSPNGACWGITVNNSGTLSTFSTPCP